MRPNLKVLPYENQREASMGSEGKTRRQFLRTSGLAVASAPLFSVLNPVQERAARRIAALDDASTPWRDLRAAYLLAPHVTYFNHGSIGTIPKTVRNAHRDYLDLCESNPWLFMWGGPWETARTQARMALAEFMDADADELAIIHNTTEGFNILANGLPLAAGDEVLFSSLNHAGASVCWHHYAARRGFSVRSFELPMNEIPAYTSADIVSLYTAQIRPETKVLVIPHIDNLVGVRHSVGEIAERTRERGVRFVAVDGAQAVGMVPVSLRQLNVDFYATSAHKWLQTPKGLGVLYVRKAVQAQLEPMWVTWGQNRWGESARQYEDYGTRNLAGVLALGDAVRFQQMLQKRGSADRLQALWSYFRSRVEADEGTTWLSPRDWSTGSALFSIGVPGMDTREVQRRMFEVHGFVFRAFQGNDWNAIRISLNCFNTRSEIDRFFTLLHSG